MKRAHMPNVDARYWFGVTLASVFGTNLGDLYAHELHLGIYLGIAMLAGLAAAAFVAERNVKRPTELFYWLVIIIIRTGATNIADFLAFRVRVPGWPLVLGLAAVVLLGGWLSAKHDTRRSDDTVDLPPTGAPYWMAMLAAGVFGTVVGDICSHVIGQGPASIGLDVALALALTVWAKTPVRSFLVYWLVVSTARTAGTAMGDWLAENKTLDIGLPISTLITGAAFVIILVLLRSRGRPLA